MSGLGFVSVLGLGLGLGERADRQLDDLVCLRGALEVLLDHSLTVRRHELPDALAVHEGGLHDLAHAGANLVRVRVSVRVRVRAKVRVRARVRGRFRVRVGRNARPRPRGTRGSRCR